MYQFKLPDIGEGTHEAEIVQWHVAVGDKVHEDDILVEVQSDKATADLPSPVDGIVTKRVGDEGELAIVGSVILEIDTGGDVDASHHDGNTAEAASKTAPVPEAASTAAEEAQPASPSLVTTTSPSTLLHAEDVDIRTLAVPRVRHFAREKGIDLRTIQGSGRSGLITMEDVEAASAAGPVTAAAPAAVPASEPPTPTPAPQNPRRAVGTDSPEKRVPMSAIRQVTAKALTRAVTSVPHVTIFDRADVGDLVDHRTRLKTLAADRGIKLTYVPYIVKACVAMLKAHPDLNAYVDMEANEIVYRSTYHIGVAVDTDNGLFVPVVRDADRLSLFEIATEIERLVDLAKSGKLTKDDMSGGSMTVTNVGGAALGGVWSTPIINMPESCIIGIGRIEEEFMPNEERQPVLRPMMKLSFAFDHRLVDGVTAQGGVNGLRTFLSNPDLLLAES
ncbi:MAG: dihydrolipoyllysine acetyltransferase [Actinobacteria bacterium]|nr:MAG: dihydrolipoyllysine acetyltransferase [Actinomycetota bacterium]